MAIKQSTGSYEKEVSRSLQNQFARVERQKIEGNIQSVNLDDSAETKAVAPTMPGENEDCMCIFCGGKIPPKRDNVPQWVVDRERKFRTCQTCRGTIVGNGGALDMATPALQMERKFNGK